MNKKEEPNPIEPSDFVEKIPARLGWALLLLVTIGLCFHVYKKGQKAFDSTIEPERMNLSTQVSVNGNEAISEKYKFVKRIRARVDDLGNGNNQKKFFIWESLSGFNAKISKDIETLSCENKKKGEVWSEDKTRKTDAWCSLVGKTIDAQNSKTTLRQLLNRNDEMVNGRYYGNSELFELPHYDPWNGLNGFYPNESESLKKGQRKISENGEYTVSIYPSVQESIFKFMSDNNMVGSVFAYRPSNGDIYCMASTPGWTERKGYNPKEGAKMNKNFYSFTPGSTMKPLTLLVMKDQGIDLNTLKFTVKQEESGWKGDSHNLKTGGRAIHCAGSHGTKSQSASEGLGNSCNSFFAMSAEMLDLEKAKKTLEDMDFFVEKYQGEPEETTVKNIGKDHARSIDNIPYNQSALPLETTMTHSFRNVENFIGEGNLLVSPIDMAVLTALFGKLSGDINSKVYFPRIWLPACEKFSECKELPECQEQKCKEKQAEGFPELLLTEQQIRTYDENSIENEHVTKLSDFVATRRESIAEVGRIWRKAYNDHYRNNNPIWPTGSDDRPTKKRHLDGDGLTAWSQWIDMAKTGTVVERPDITHPKYNECREFKCETRNSNGECIKYTEECKDWYDVPKTRKQRTLSLYSEELDLAAYIVIENYSGAHVTSKIKLDSTSLKLTELVAKALGKELVDPEKKNIQDTQLKILEERFEQKKSNVGQTPKKETLKKGKGKVVKDKKKGTKSGTTKKVNGQNSPKPNKGKTKTPNKKAPQKSKSKKR